MDIYQHLKHTFGFDTFRYSQDEIIEAVLEGKDALVIMPTGGGKSLCYQIPALVQPGLTVVISPLIALMNDQVTALRQINVAASALHSNLSATESQYVYSEIENKQLKLLYISPERLLSNGFLTYLSKQDISLFAIDEAHCVSVWGNDFRPEYVKLSVLKTSFPNIPTIGLTATADQATQKDIITQLKLDVKDPFLSSFERKNIHMASRPGVKRMDQIINFVIQKSNTAGIIYCLSRKSTEKVAERLQVQGIKAKAYHAGLGAEERKTIQTAFQNDDIDIVCATIAFGMGIDKPNIRWVIHYNMPKNIEGYYQEIGRSGRDGEPAESLLFASWGDFLNLQKFIDESQANDTFKTVQRAKLERMWQFASATSCRTNLILNYFGEYRSESCNHCDNCENPPELFDGTKYTQMALSGIIRLNEEAGLNLLIDLLKGTYSNEIKHRNAQHLKTFGVGREVPFTHWRHFITQMINQGIISIDYTDHFRLKSTPLSQRVLSNSIKIQLAEYISPTARKKARVPILAIDTSDADGSLLEKLRDWRRGIAIDQGVPAYVVLHDIALLQMATIKPTTSQQLLGINGIGQVKLEKYGEQLLRILEG